jgi:imidazoleglycerol phosphate dehydratase HisB
MSAVQQPQQKQKKKTPKEPPKKAFAERRFATYIHKKAKAKEISLNGPALVAAELLVEHIVDTLAANARSAVKYGKNGTLSDKHMKAATQTALGGRLRTAVVTAGEVAVESYKKSIGKPAPKPKKA